jgi:hypothetical protein
MTAIPQFVINRVYVKGSLRQLAHNTVSFFFQSGMMSGHLTGVEQICLGSVCVGPEAVVIHVDEAEHPATSLAHANPLWVPAQCKLAMTLSLPASLEVLDHYELTLALHSLELGPFSFTLHDELQPA